MRTVKRQVRDLNAGKRSVLDNVAQAYAAEKQFWLQEFFKAENRRKLKAHRQVRNLAVANHYVSPVGLQARMWKLALADAAETLDKYWQSLFVELRARIHRYKALDEADKRYGFWLLCGYEQVFSCMEKEIPVPSFEIAAARCVKVASFVRRNILKLQGRRPNVHTARSFVLDANCYSVFVKKNVQYLSIMTLVPRQRLVLPLAGHVAIAGNIRVVLGPERVSVHTSHRLTASEPVNEDAAATVEAIDLGYSEVCVDTSGHRYGVQLPRKRPRRGIVKARREIVCEACGKKPLKSSSQKKRETLRALIWARKNGVPARRRPGLR